MVRSSPAPSALQSRRVVTTGAVARLARAASSSPGIACRSTGAPNAILLPSGDQTGAPAPSGSEVSRSGSPPPAGSSQSWAGPPSARRNAILVPSGDQAGAASAVPLVSRRGWPAAR